MPLTTPALPASATSTARSRRSSLQRAGFVICVFLLVLSVKLTAIGRYGTDVPYWDQWAKEGEFVFAPWFERHELWKNLFVPHNEHRIAPTLALNFGLLRLGGDQWDARVQCAASAALHALIAAGLAAWAFRNLGRRRALAAAAAIILVTAPPIAWENVLGGFQSQFYFLAGFSLLSIGWILSAPVFSARWLGGVLCAALAIVSMGSGLLVAAPLAAIALLRMADPGNRRHALTLLATALVAGAVGAWFRPQAPWHAVLHAHNAAEYVTYFARCLSWPLYDRPWLAPFLWLPWLALLAVRIGSLRTRLRDVREGPAAEDQRRGDFCLAAGIWVLVQVAAVSYSRAGNGAMPASRYGDIFALGLIFNAFALGLLWSKLRPVQHHAAGRVRVLVITAACVWTGAMLTAVSLGTKAAYEDPLPTKKAQSVAYERNVRAFVQTDDYATFSKQELLPFPSAEWLARIIRNPAIRPLLPASIRASGAASPLSSAVERLAKHGAWLALPSILGLLGFGWLVARTPDVECGT